MLDDFCQGRATCMPIMSTFNVGKLQCLVFGGPGIVSTLLFSNEK